MAVAEKEFVIAHIFRNVSSMRNEERHFSPIENHFDVPWRISVMRCMNQLALHLFCEERNDNEWSIDTWTEMKIKAVNGRTFSETCNDTFTSTGDATHWGWQDFINWRDMMRDYVFNDTLRVEIHVKIRRMTGITKKILMSFDESTREFSDVALVVENRKFYVLKWFLARHSSYFKTLLLGNFEESRQPEVTLQNIDPDNFQTFLEVLHGEPAIDDGTVERTLELAEMYDTPVCVKRCEQFLMEKSRKTMVSKFGISARFKLDELKEKCIRDINGFSDLQSVVEANMDQMDLESAMIFLRKFVSL